MTKIYVAGKQLGQGSYGTVVHYTNESQTDYAVKSFTAKEANLLEISLMASYRHPYLIHAEYIDYDKETINLFMPVAVSDLAHQIRKPHSVEVRKRWCYQIAKGIACLHRDDFIHADMKSNNILYMKDQTVKITDYTLTVKQWHRDQTFGGSACTINYRAPEIFLGEWGREIDIWALGCVFYEIIFGVTLFHHHKDYRDSDRKTLWQRMYNQLLAWREMTSDEPLDEQLHPVEYHPLTLAESYHQPQYDSFRNLLVRMLDWNRNTRITITDVISHPWFAVEDSFTGLQESMVYLRRVAAEGGTGNVDRQNRLITIMYGLTDDTIVRRLALHYIQRLSQYTDLPESIIAHVCTTIANKIVHRSEEQSKIEESYYQYEAKIVTALGFVLH
jgi:serine/threonine protein kinase